MCILQKLWPFCESIPECSVEHGALLHLTVGGHWVGHTEDGERREDNYFSWPLLAVTVIEYMVA